MALTPSSVAATSAALLAPWLEHARACMTGSLDDLAEPADLDEYLWIEWLVAHHSAEDWMLTLETMELLDLLVRVDYVAGWTFICEIVDLSLYVGLLEDLPRKVYPKHTIEWAAIGDDESSRFERAKLLVSPIPDGLYSPAFLRAKVAMVALLGCDQCGTEDRIRLCIKLEPNSVEEAEEDLRHLSTFAALAQEPTRLELLREVKRVGPVPSETRSTPVASAQETHHSVFRVDRTTINTSRVTLTDPMLSSMRAIEQSGVRIGALTIGRSRHAPRETSPSVTTDLFRSIILADARSSTTALSIGHDMDASVFQAICSSLLATQRVNDVTFTGDGRLSGYWAWIAYAVFSCEASPRIQYTHLDLQHFGHHAVTEIQRVLRARDPLAAIAPTPSVTIPENAVERLRRERQVVDVRPNTAGLVGIPNVQRDICILSIGDGARTDLRVVDESISRSHVCVLYPGAGLCWIPRDSIVARRALPEPAPQLRATCLERISLELGPNTPLPALLALVQLVGPLARILFLYSSQHVALPDQFLRDVLTACPNLVRLDLVLVTLSSFSWLLDNPAASHVRQLTLTRVRCLDAGGYLALVNALRDTRAGAGRSLRELAIYDHWRVLSALWLDLLSALTVNYHLQRLIVRAEIAVRTEAIATVTDQFHGHHGDALHARAGALPLRSRLALLSVWGSNAALPALDATVLSIVFAFAAQNKRRVCGLEVCASE